MVKECSVKGAHRLWVAFIGGVRRGEGVHNLVKVKPCL